MEYYLYVSSIVLGLALIFERFPVTRTECLILAFAVLAWPAYLICLMSPAARKSVKTLIQKIARPKIKTKTERNKQ